MQISSHGSSKSCQASRSAPLYDPNLWLPLWASAESAGEGILSVWETADINKVRECWISNTEKSGPWLFDSEEKIYDDAVVHKLWNPNLRLLLVIQRFLDDFSLLPVIFQMQSSELTFLTIGIHLLMDEMDALPFLKRKCLPVPAVDPCKEVPFKEMNYLDAPPLLHLLPVVRESRMFMKARFRRKNSQRRHLLRRPEQGFSETGVPP